jgi:hypothetical protein
MKKMAKEYPESQQYLLLFLVSHIIELLLFEDKLNVMNYIYSLKSIPQNSIEKYIKNYFEKNTITTPKYTIFIGYNLNKQIILFLDDTNKWVQASPEEHREISLLKEVYDALLFTTNDYNKTVGFIGYEKNNDNLVFKTKNITAKRDTGARCDQSSKNKNLEKLNEILGEEKYTIQNTKSVKEKDGTIVHEAMGKIEICVFEEFILRYFNAIKKNEKKWFITPEMAIYYKLYTVFTK